MNAKDIKALQGKLTKLGLDVGKIDGVFGAKTEAAVRAFQTKAGLVVDGIAGPKTLAALDEATAPKMMTIPSSAFDDAGWYTGAIRVPTPLRMGGTIKPKGAVVHTTDTLPGGMPNILRRWVEMRDSGAGANFMIGRRAPTVDELDDKYPSAGVVQMIPITRNGNHAGGPSGHHGWVDVDGTKLHPNSVYVGIELDAGGKLKQMQSRVMHEDTGKFVDEADVYRDEQGKPWHKITDYQFEQLAKLLDALDAYCGRLPVGAKLVPNGSYALNNVKWAALPGTRFVTHVALDPIRKTDPGPQGTKWLIEHGYAAR